MVDIKEMLPDLRGLVRKLAEDLLARSSSDPRIDAGLKEAFHQVEKGGRTAQAFEVWRDDYLDQVAVAWVLACVFVRFLEDNHLIDECWLAGEGDRRKLAEDTHELFFRAHPHDTDREYFHHVFHEVGKIPAAKDLFAEGKTPLWAVAPSGDGAMALLKFWREIDAETGRLQRSFEVEERHTRFLGDLYQELSERAKKKYALLQTPVFVEEFILDRTLTPAIAEFGLEKVRMIDPTCGSGHFLLGGFVRLFRLWSERESNEIKAAQNALDGVWGVDINPFAVAIARFRLIVAAVNACGITRLKQAPGWKIHLATGDSLLFGSRWHLDGTKREEARYLDDSWAPKIYACEDREAVNDILGQQYHAVVGNPPYITPKDRACNNAYRERYITAYDKYHLSTPFTERFFELGFARTQEHGCGYIGAITDNGFMKRDYGIRLVEDFFPKVDLTHIIDTSSAYIPGHGTPTVIIFGRNRPPNEDTIRAVLGIKGAQATPEDPSQGVVWLSLIKHVDSPGTQDEYSSAADVLRTTFSVHPWSIGGGGASELVESIAENVSRSLSEMTESVGITSFTLEDDVYILPIGTAKRHQLAEKEMREMVVGDMVRDWFISPCDPTVFPYDSASFRPIDENSRLPVFRYLWHYRTNLANSKMFGGRTKVQAGLRWYEFGRLTHSKLRTPLSIVFAFVATHNHFVLDRGGKVFKQSAPIIKLQSHASEDDHLALLGLLNSSTACFWLKQTSHNKGSTVDQHGARQRTAPFEDFYEFTGTVLQRFPLPDVRPLELPGRLNALAYRYAANLPGYNASSGTPDGGKLLTQRFEAMALRREMIALQEESDWECYRSYGLLSDDCNRTSAPPEINLGERAFEIVMARQMAKGELETTWFERHGSTPITEIPEHWPAAYRRLVELRIEIIQTNKDIALIEKPEYKRRWNDEPWEDQELRALKNWLLDRLETERYRKAKQSPELTTTAQMADIASADADFLQVATLYRGRPDFNVAALVAELVEAEAVPFLPVLRYKPTGLRKREVWERTWELQREQDRGKDVGDIPVPPKYGKPDFLKDDYWRLRGKLDVPKERWISYPFCSTDSDPSLLVGWAGWDHLEQATALVAYYDARKREGWDAKRLTPLLAGLDQLLPWIHQWHPEVDPEFGETAGQSFQTLLEHDAHELGLTLDDIRRWTPPEKKTGRRKTKV